MKIILTVDSNFDSETEPVYKYRREVLYPKLANLPQWQVVCLNDLPLTSNQIFRQKLIEQILIQNVKFVSGSGHGLPKIFFGNASKTSPPEYLFKVNNYAADEIRDKIVHLHSCWSGQKLGRDMVRKGCLAFFGYDLSFSYPTAENVELQKKFFECDAEIDIAIAEGATAEQAYQRAMAKFNNLAQEIEDTYHGNDKADIMAALENNKVFLCSPTRDSAAWGNPQAKLE